MLVILFLIVIIGIIYFPSKKSVQKNEMLGKRHLENINKLDPYAQKVIESWVDELYEEMGTDKLDKPTLHKLIGIKILQSKNTDELGENFKELRD